VSYPPSRAALARTAPDATVAPPLPPQELSTSSRCILCRFRGPEKSALLALCILQTWLIATHEPWFDEVHALLIAREPWVKLFSALKYEGHPSLWYVFLGSVDAAIGPSSLSLPAAQLIIAISTLSLIWLRSPFPWAAKLLISVSYYVVFEYGAISRSYSLGTLLALAAVTLRTSVWSWVCLALLANVAAHFTLLAVALGAVLFIRDRSWRGAAILGMGCFAAVITVYPLAPDIYYAPLRADRLMRLVRTTADISAAMVPSVPGVPYRYGELLPTSLGFHLGLALPIVAALALRDFSLTLGFVAVYAGLVVFGTDVYELSPRHVGVLFVFLIAGLWLRREQNSEPLPVWAWAWLAVTGACGVPYLATSHMQPFTKSSHMAEWVQAHGLAQELFGAWPGRAGTLLTAQLGVPTINVAERVLKYVCAVGSQGRSSSRSVEAHSRLRCAIRCLRDGAP
jgi:hypothetical protein